jgi:hypothetical protein
MVFAFEDHARTNTDIDRNLLTATTPMVLGFNDDSDDDQ